MFKITITGLICTRLRDLISVLLFEKTEYLDDELEYDKRNMYTS